VANLIHRRSRRRAGRLLTINCAGVPDSLLESELFGHLKGSFTGAYRDKPGLFEQAQNGTVFLDEVGEMTLRMQAVLLRFLESGELQRVGATQTHGHVNVRVIAATNRDPRAQIEAGTFRDDLYYRLNVIRIHVPPLRERKDDVAPLVEHFLRLCSREHGSRQPTISAEALQMLRAYDWPGNVRQLRNVVEQLILKAVDRQIHVHDLPVEIRIPSVISVASDPATVQQTKSASPSAAGLVAQMIDEGQSFWSVVHPMFMDRDLSRSLLREIVSRGLARAAGNYRILVGLFNMPATDYKRFLSFLRKHDCMVAFRPFRVPPPRPAIVRS
jgi:transcriptional regulator with PAS, ATPase and Fis domain